MTFVRRLTVASLLAALPVVAAPATPALAATSTINLVTDGTIGSIGVDAVYGGNGGGAAYDLMVRWSSDGRLWSFQQTPGATNFGWRTGQVNGLTVPGSPEIVRLEIYPHPVENCSGTDESQHCYWVTYDPWVGSHGGVQVQLEQSKGGDWLDAGSIRLPTLGRDGAFRLNGPVIARGGVLEGQVEVDVFQIDCGYFETCVAPPHNERDVAYGSFATSKSRGNEWTGGVVWPGRYLMNVRDTVRGRSAMVMTDISADRIPTIDLDAVCFGFGQCVYDRGSAPTASGNFHPVSPSRILDTRIGLGIANGAVSPGDGKWRDTNPYLRVNETANHEVKVTGVGGVPETGVSAVLLNVTAVDPSTEGFVTIGPRPAATGDIFDLVGTYGAWPSASNLNVRAGITTPNLVLARVGAGGKVRIYNQGNSLHMVADVAGWFDSGSVNTSGGTTFVGTSPTRILDTRNDGTGAFAPGNDRSLTIAGRAGVPANAESVVLNVTAVSPAGRGYVTVYPDGTGSRPEASNLNLVAGQDRPNLVVVKLGAGGRVRLAALETSAHLLVDVFGYYAPAVGRTGSTSAVEPVRILDTRTGVGGAARMFGPGETRRVQVAGVQGIPSTATAVYLNVTSVNASRWGWLSVWPADEQRPDASNVNFPGGTVVSNMVIVRLGKGGALDLYNDAGIGGVAGLNGTSSHVLVDVMGYVS